MSAHARSTEARQETPYNAFGRISVSVRLGGSTIHAAIANKRTEPAELCRRYGVARLEVFGSLSRTIAIDRLFQVSDADFLVEFDPNSGLAPFDQFFDLAEALRRTLERPVDLVESGTVHNPYLRAAINRSRELIYAS